MFFSTTKGAKFPVRGTICPDGQMLFSIDITALTGIALCSCAFRRKSFFCKNFFSFYALGKLTFFI
jgi:hypothetical protein